MAREWAFVPSPGAVEVVFVPPEESQVLQSGEEAESRIPSFSFQRHPPSFLSLVSIYFLIFEFEVLQEWAGE